MKDDQGEDLPDTVRVHFNFTLHRWEICLAENECNYRFHGVIKVEEEWP